MAETMDKRQKIVCLVWEKEKKKGGGGEYYFYSSAKLPIFSKFKYP